MFEYFLASVNTVVGGGDADYGEIMGIPDTEFVIADPVVPGGSRNSYFRYNFILFHQPAVGFLHHFSDRFSAFAGYDLRIHRGKDGCHIGG